MIVPSRCFLLLVGDDCAFLFPPASMKELGPVLATTHSDEDARALLQTLRRHPAVPVLLLADTGGQQVRIETLPPVARLDRRKIVQRRLEQAFPDAPLKTSLPLGKERSVLFSIEEGGALALWQSRLALAPNPDAGVASLPIEAAGLIPRLDPQAAKGWALLILWQRSGGFRQIVTLDGKMVFTRLAAQLPDSASAQSALGFIAVDLQAAQGYLARFGLPADKPPRLIALLPPELGSAFRAVFHEQTPLVLSPHEAALRLGLTPVFTPKEPFCDALCASWIASRPLLTRLMMKPRERALYLRRLLDRAGLAAAALLFALALGVTGGTLAQSVATSLRTQRLESSIAGLEDDLSRLNAAPEAGFEPLARLRLAVQKRRFFTQERTDDLPLLIPALAQAFEKGERLKALEGHPGLWTLELATGTQTDKDALLSSLDALAQKIAARLPAYTVQVTNYSFPALPQETLTSAAGGGGFARLLLKAKETRP